MSYHQTFWGSPSYRGRDYGFRATVYTRGYHRGQDIRYEGRTIAVPALLGGTVVRRYYNASTGWNIVLDTGPRFGRYHAYGHMYGPALPSMGSYVSTGASLGRVAGWGESPGSAWNGPHLHFLVSDSADAMNNPWSPEYDPRPIISSILASPAGQIGDADMTPAESHMLLNIYNAIFTGGDSMADGGRSLSTSVGDLMSAQRPQVNRIVDGKTVQISWLQELADAKSIGIRTEGKVDQLIARTGLTDAQVKALGEQIAAGLVKAGVGKGVTAAEVSSIVGAALGGLTLKASG